MITHKENMSDILNVVVTYSAELPLYGLVLHPVTYAKLPSEIRAPHSTIFNAILHITIYPAFVYIVKLTFPPVIDLNARIDAHRDEPCKTLVDNPTE